MKHAAPLVHRLVLSVDCCFESLSGGFPSPNWIPWVLLAAGVLGLEYTPVEEHREKRQRISFSYRNKASIAMTILGVAILVGLAIYYNRR
jgi:hypothetical protein